MAVNAHQIPLGNQIKIGSQGGAQRIVISWALRRENICIFHSPQHSQYLAKCQPDRKEALVQCLLNRRNDDIVYLELFFVIYCSITNYHKHFQYFLFCVARKIGMTSLGPLVLWLSFGAIIGRIHFLAHSHGCWQDSISHRLSD